MGQPKVSCAIRLRGPSDRLDESLRIRPLKSDHCAKGRSITTALISQPSDVSILSAWHRTPDTDLRPDKEVGIELGFGWVGLG